MCSLKVRFSQNAERRGVYCYALRVEVIFSKGVPSKIFVFHQMPKGVDGNTFSEFDHIATPVDFQEIPEDAASETCPWFRTDKCVVWLRNAEDIRTAKQLFVDDIQELQKTYDILSSEENFSNQTTVEFDGNGNIEPYVPGHEEEGILDGVTISTRNLDRIRTAVETIGKALGAKVETRT